MTTLGGLRLPTTVRGTSKQSVVAIIDQAVSSGTNIVLMMLVANALSARAFGTFSAAYLIYVVVLGITRGVVCEPVLVRPSARNDGEGSVSGVATVIALIAGGAVLAAMPFVGAGLGPTLVVLAFGLPGLLLLDLRRYQSFACEEAHRALLIDIAWAVLLTLSVLGLMVTGFRSPGSFLAAWVGSAWFVVMGSSRGMRLPSVGRARAWLRNHGDLGYRYGAEYLVGAGLSEASVLIVGAILGVSALAALRGLAVLFGPLNVLSVGLIASVLPVAVTMRETGRRREVRLLLVYATAGAAVTSLLLLALFAVAGGILGPLLLGETWNLARGILIPFGIGVFLGAVALGPTVAGRAAQDAATAVWVRALTGLAILIGAVSGAVMSELSGAVVGTAIGRGVGTLAWLVAAWTKDWFAPAPRPVLVTDGSQ